MLYLLSTLAFAQDLPELAPPVRAPDEATDCKQKLPLLEGDTTSCDAIAYPPSYAAYLEEHRPYSQQLELRLVSVQAVGEAKLAACEAQVEWRDGEIERLLEPPPRPPLAQRPGFLVPVTAVTTLGIVVATGWTLGQL